MSFENLVKAVLNDEYFIKIGFYKKDLLRIEEYFTYPDTKYFQTYLYGEFQTKPKLLFQLIINLQN